MEVRHGMVERTERWRDVSDPLCERIMLVDVQAGNTVIVAYQLFVEMLEKLGLARIED
jgi:hypothetical protein